MRLTACIGEAARPRQPEEAACLEVRAAFWVLEGAGQSDGHGVGAQATPSTGGQRFVLFLERFVKSDTFLVVSIHPA